MYKVTGLVTVDVGDCLVSQKLLILRSLGFVLMIYLVPLGYQPDSIEQSQGLWRSVCEADVGRYRKGENSACSLV